MNKRRCLKVIRKQIECLRNKEKALLPGFLGRAKLSLRLECTDRIVLLKTAQMTPQRDSIVFTIWGSRVFQRAILQPTY